MAAQRHWSAEVLEEFVGVAASLINAQILSKAEKDTQLRAVVRYRKAVTSGVATADRNLTGFRALATMLDVAWDRPETKAYLIADLSECITALEKSITEEENALAEVTPILFSLPNGTFDQTVLENLSSAVTLELRLMRVASLVCAALFQNHESFQQACNEFVKEVKGLDDSFHAGLSRSPEGH
jgi:hypothetical protein